MKKDFDLDSLDGKSLLSLAVYVGEFNIDFFRSWANRMRAYDLDAVELLHQLAEEARQYLDTLYATADRLFDGRLLELDADLYKEFTLQLQLPQNRYFVISAEEANSALSTALTLQKNAIELLMRIDEIYQHEMRDGSIFAGAGVSAGKAHGKLTRISY